MKKRTSRIVYSCALLTLCMTTGSARGTPKTEGIPTVLQQVRIGDAPLAPNTGMSPPIALVHPAPMWTLAALLAGVEGTVTVRAQFDMEGNFSVLEVVNTLGYGLDDTALAALQNWTFRPAYRSGRRVAVVANIDVEFRQSEAFQSAFREEHDSLRATRPDVCRVLTVACDFPARVTGGNRRNAPAEAEAVTH